jgi:hypothetical protein
MNVDVVGPLSETISNVSWRDCALAGDQIAGAGRRCRRQARSSI